MRRWHAARLTEPAEAYRLRHPHPHRRVLARQTRRDGRPEPPPILSPRHPRPPRRPQLTPQGPIRAPLTCHRNILPRCCDDRLNPPSMPVSVCRFARAHRCRSIRNLSAFGHGPVAHQTYYGLRLHLRVAWPGVITAATLAPANEADLAVAPQLLAGLVGWALGDEGYWSPALRAELAADGLHLIAPPRGKSAGARRWPPRLVQTRRRIETVLAQLTERYHAKRVRARDEWHLVARWLRKLASHTLAVLLCRRAGLAPLAFERLLAT